MDEEKKILNSDQKIFLAINNLHQFHDAPGFEPSVTGQFYIGEICEFLQDNC